LYLCFTPRDAVFSTFTLHVIPHAPYLDFQGRQKRVKERKREGGKGGEGRGRDGRKRTVPNVSAECQVCANKLRSLDNRTSKRVSMY